MYGSVTSSTISSEESFECHEHNIWNLLLESMCHSVVSVFMEALRDALWKSCDKLFFLPVMKHHIFFWENMAAIGQNEVLVLIGSPGEEDLGGQTEWVVCRQKHHPAIG